MGEMKGAGCVRCGKPRDLHQWKGPRGAVVSACRECHQHATLLGPTHGWWWLTKSQSAADRKGRPNERLIAFLYDLLRDYLPAGVVERIVKDNEQNEQRMIQGGVVYSNADLAAYAEKIARRLLRPARVSRSRERAERGAESSR